MTNISSSARYTMVAAKNKWEEQGFHFDDGLPNYGLEQFVYNRLNELGWFRLTQQPARANYNWELEFYTSNSAGEDNAMVRGRRVAANATTINSILGLPNDDPSFYAMLSALEDEDFEQIKDYLCEEDTTWNTTGRNPHSVSHLSLRPEAKLWNTFVKRNIMPTSHNQTVDRTRLLLIHTILTGYRINVGEIMAKELAAACVNDKGILAFPCLISALCRRAAVPAHHGDKFQAEKKAWTRAVYMRKMDVADATPLNMAMPTPPASPDHMPAAATDEAGPSNPAAASSASAEPGQPSADSPPVVPAASHTTPSPAATLADLPASRESTPNSPMGSTPEAPHSPPPAQSDEAATNAGRNKATTAAHHSTNTPPIPSANPSDQAGNTETLHLSSDDENDVFDWQSPRDHLQPAGPSQPTMAVPILSPAPTPANSVADRPTPDSPARRKSKTTAGRTITRSDPTSPEEEATHQPAQKRRRCHIITSDSDDDCSAAVPTSSADASLSFTF
ncbi:hypothetical protein V6N12_065795 [Hibiscus sabdariffa]|uniref:Putative plant transposon protein domain-containing protein n=1 Tax=Hibiscus sabdariffa TaxID=183260 RepID=A0ABR2G9S0_9ROSI